MKRNIYVYMCILNICTSPKYINSKKLVFISKYIYITNGDYVGAL